MRFNIYNYTLVVNIQWLYDINRSLNELITHLLQVTQLINNILIYFIKYFRYIQSRHMVQPRGNTRREPEGTGKGLARARDGLQEQRNCKKLFNCI